nr:PilZ domain-containing protein [Desulfosarcina ovata]
MNAVPHRRQFSRYTAVFSTKYTVKEGTFRDLIQNIGAGGAFIRSRRKIIQGRTINIQIPVFAFGRRLSIMGTVVRSHPEGFAVMFKEAMEMRLLKDGRFPANLQDVTQSTIKIDKNSIS